MVIAHIIYVCMVCGRKEFPRGLDFFQMNSTRHINIVFAYSLFATFERDCFTGITLCGNYILIHIHEHILKANLKCVCMGVCTTSVYMLMQAGNRSKPMHLL